MAEKLLICISAQQISAARWAHGRIAACQLFGNHDEGLAEFKEFLATFSNVPVHVMIDAVEEDYRFETLPHAFGSDRIDMVNRKLKQHYRNTPYVTAWLQGRDSGKRRDDHYLFAALTNPALAASWVQAAVEQGLPIAGIYLLPIVSAALLDKLKVTAGKLLIVAQHSGGLRITFFHDGQFRLSRLTHADAAGSENRGRIIASEISNTLLYLHALRATTLDEPLTVLLLDRNDELTKVPQHVAQDNPSFDCVRVGRRQLALQLGIDERLLGTSPDVVYLHLLGLKAPRSNLAPAALTLGYRRYQARRAIYAAAGAVALVATGWCGFNVHQILDVGAQTAEAARHTAQQQAQYQETTRQFPAAPTSADNLKKAVEVAQRLRETARTPEVMMAIVSKALEASPAIAVREFGWKYGLSEIEAGGTTSRVAGNSPPSPGGAVSLRKQSGLIEGEIRPFRGDYRAAIETINAFADRLAGDPAVDKVRVVKLPLNVNPTLSLSGNTLDNREQSAKAEFRLLLVLKPNL